MSWKDYVFLGLSLFVGFGAGAYYTHSLIDEKWQNFAPIQYQRNTFSVNLERQVDFIEGSEQALPSTVSIRAWKSNRKESTGAGVIFNTQGYIVTNYHVVKSSQWIEVELYNQVKLEARLMGYDEYTDLAVLKVQTDIPLKPIVFGNSDNLKIGQWVLAIGCPFHLHATVTKGIISGLGRDIGGT